MLLITRVLIPAGRVDEAVQAAEKIRAPATRYMLTRYIRARQAAERGDWDRARREAAGLEQLVDESMRPFLLMLVGRLAEVAGDDTEAIRRFRQAERGASSQADLEAARAALIRVRSRHAARLEALRQSVRKL